ncbi:hypothetical protein BDW02DRAFT_78971 [Decorospora gaudefroyi]|uniref:Uncharacterized protein n=1 Tax=Decorospora gaudefroyi TaxID=184978 RepID=A0A6A5K8W1_9PLEO|nr:hypothetical protein BDW02DRAFT_78971 [Decorospora gaudefroyi]
MRDPILVEDNFHLGSELETYRSNLATNEQHDFALCCYGIKTYDPAHRNLSAPLFIKIWESDLRRRDLWVKSGREYYAMFRQQPLKQQIWPCAMAPGEVGRAFPDQMRLMFDLNTAEQMFLNSQVDTDKKNTFCAYLRGFKMTVFNDSWDRKTWHRIPMEVLLEPWVDPSKGEIAAELIQKGQTILDPRSDPKLYQIGNDAKARLGSLSAERKAEFAMFYYGVKQHNLDSWRVHGDILIMQTWNALKRSGNEKTRLFYIREGTRLYSEYRSIPFAAPTGPGGQLYDPENRLPAATIADVTEVNRCQVREDGNQWRFERTIYQNPQYGDLRRILHFSLGLMIWAKCSR